MNHCLRCVIALIAFCSIDPAIVVGQENVVIVLDDSGSMNQRMKSGLTRMEAAKRAISEVIKQFPESTQLGLFLLNGASSKQHWALPLAHLSKTESQHVIKSLRADGGTPLGDRIREGTDALLKLREKQIYGVYRLLVVTDGEANDVLQLAAYLPDVLSRGVIVDVIGVDMSKDHSLATRVHSYRRADDEAALQKAVQEVFAEKNDVASTSTDKDDYQLLQALENETAREALKLLSKPNNGPIVGIHRPETWVAKPPAPANRLGLPGVLMIGFLTCMFPLFMFFFIVSLMFFKARRR